MGERPLQEIELELREAKALAQRWAEEAVRDRDERDSFLQQAVEAETRAAHLLRDEKHLEGLLERAVALLKRACGKDGQAWPDRCRFQNDVDELLADIAAPEVPDASE